MRHASRRGVSGRASPSLDRAGCLRRGRQNRRSKHVVASRRRSPVRLPIPTNELGFGSASDAYTSQARAASCCVSCSVAASWPQHQLLARCEYCADFLLRSTEQDWMSAPDEPSATEGALDAELADSSRWGSISGSSSDVSGVGNLLSESSLSVDSTADDVDGAAAAAPALPASSSNVAGVRGAWRSLLTRLTPSWLSPRVRGLGLLWLLVALVATNW